MPKNPGQKSLSGFALYSKCKYNILNNKDIMLGLLNCEDKLLVNHVLLIAKQYLYFCCCRKTFPLLKVFMSRLRTIQNLELVIAKSKNKLSLRTARNGAISTRSLCT